MVLLVVVTPRGRLLVWHLLLFDVLAPHHHCC
jgi:hypothetical protein